MEVLVKWYTASILPFIAGVAFTIIGCHTNAIVAVIGANGITFHSVSYQTVTFIAGTAEGHGAHAYFRIIDLGPGKNSF